MTPTELTLTYQNKLVLIDFDGVILKNSLHLACKVLYNVMRLNTNIPYETVEQFVKLSNSFSPETTFPFFFQSLGLDRLQANVRNEIRRIAELHDGAANITPGFKNFITLLRDRSVEFRIFSLANSNRILKSLDYVLESEIYNLNNTSKADVKTFYTLLEVTNRNGDSILYVDDDPLALMTAKMTEINTVLMRNKFFSERDIFPYQPNIDLCVDDFIELSDALTSSQ